MIRKKKRQEEEAIPSPQEEAAAAETQTEAVSEQPGRDLEKELAESAAKAEEYLTLAQRVKADFENFRKRNQSVRAEAYEDGAAAFIKTLLPAIDNLERALEAKTQDESLRQGVALVLKQIKETLEKRGVKEISRQGEPFDPKVEEAVMQADASEGEPGTVCQVLQKGYMLGDTVLRHAMVRVVAGE